MVIEYMVLLFIVNFIVASAMVYSFEFKVIKGD